MAGVAAWPTVRLAIWRRALAPSFADWLFVSLLLWLFVAGSGWITLLADGDTGWHIRTGEYILDSHTIPTKDLFSFSKTGEPWFAWEWLSDIVFALLHRQWGLKGVVVLAGMLIAVAALVVFRHMLWRGANVFVALAATLLCIGASSIHFLARPHVFTLLLLPLALWILERDRRAPGAAVWSLVPLTALWVNLHGGFVALLACVALVAAGHGIEGWLNKSDGRCDRGLLRRYCLMLLACAAASLVNPYGIRLHLHIARYLRSDWIRDAVDEFQSPKFRSENVLQFELLLLTALLLAGVALARRRVAGVLPVLFWAHLALGSARHVPLFALVAAPFVAEELSRYWDTWTRASSTKSVVAVLGAVARDLSGSFRRTSVWAPGLALSLVLLCPASKWPRDFPEAKFPVALVQDHANYLAGARVFTSDEWGDYLIYRGWPTQKVFIDGRTDFYGPIIGKEYLRLAHGHPDWQHILKKYDFAAALVPKDWPLAALLKRHTDWRQKAEDAGAVLFERSSSSLPCRANQTAGLLR